VLEQLKLHTLCDWRYHFDEFFHIKVYLGSNFYPSLLETFGLQVPARYVREIPMLNVCSFLNNFPSASCAAASNEVYRDVDVFRTKIVLPNHVL
jgi:hypothetical protein